VTGSTIEFGQGTQVTIACDTSVQTAVGETWNSAAQTFYATTITATLLDNETGTSATQSNQGCGGKTFKVALYNLSNVASVIGSDSSTVISLVIPNSDTPSLGTITGLTSSTGVTGSISNTNEATISSVTKSGSTLTFSYANESALSPITVGNYLSLKGSASNYCDFTQVAVTAVTGTVTSGTFSVTSPAAISSSCITGATVSGATLYGNSVLQLTLPSSLTLTASSVGRISIETQ
jgi:hypothetical protein